MKKLKNYILKKRNRVRKFKRIRNKDTEDFSPILRFKPSIFTVLFKVFSTFLLR